MKTIDKMVKKQLFYQCVASDVGERNSRGGGKYNRRQTDSRRDMRKSKGDCS